MHHADCVDSVVAAIEEADLQEVTLVGHSFGGSIVAKVAEFDGSHEAMFTRPDDVAGALLAVSGSRRP